MDILFYNIFLHLYGTAIRIASLFNRKAGLWLSGRKNIFEKLNASIPKGSSVIWMHCASLGEFEQGRPVLEKLKETYPTHKILLTFFSPSGYEIRKNYNVANWVFYLPLDTKANAQKFIKIVNPKLVIFVKYEYWYHYLQQLNVRNITTILISAIFRKDAVFFKWYGSLHRKMATYFSHVFVQTEDSFSRIQSVVPVERLSLSGDTRFDRVVAVAAGFEPLPVIEKFIEDKNNIIVAGSTWPEDEQMLQKLLVYQQSISLIIAPHEISNRHIAILKNIFPDCLLYSELNQPNSQVTNQQKVRVLIIDNIGMLSKLYKYATVSYIGGGFNKSGIHNTLEAAVYGKPVVFGPNYQKFAEAINLLKNNAAFTYTTEQELIAAFNQLITNPDLLLRYSKNAKNFVVENVGATGQIIAWLEKKAMHDRR